MSVFCFRVKNVNTRGICFYAKLLKMTLPITDIVILLCNKLIVNSNLFRCNKVSHVLTQCHCGRRERPKSYYCITSWLAVWWLVGLQAASQLVAMEIAVLAGLEFETVKYVSYRPLYTQYAVYNAYFRRQRRWHDSGQTRYK